MTAPFTAPTPMPATARWLSALGGLAQRHSVISSMVALPVAVLIPVLLTPVALGAAAAGTLSLILLAAPCAAIAAAGSILAFWIAVDPARAGRRAAQLAAHLTARALIGRAMRPRASRHRFAEPDEPRWLDSAAMASDRFSAGVAPTSPAPNRLLPAREGRLPGPERDLA